MGFLFKCSTCVLAFVASVVSAEDYNIQHNDGSYEFGYDNPDSFHHSKANRRNFVRGEYGARNPKTGRIDVTSYTAGPRGYRPRGKNIVRKFDQNQNRGRPVGSRDDPYFDPNEDPSYRFGFKTRTHSRQEAANSLGDVTGKYSYLDDVGEKHDVEYIAGKNTGFHVKTPFPDSNPRGYGPLFFRGRGKPIPRGRTSIQRGLDGSYKFVSAGPDQRRTETSDASGNVRGSYTYLDDKGVKHSVHYIAGPKIGYRVLKNVKGPHLPSVFPFSSSAIIPSDFYNYLDDASNGDVFDTAASSRPKPGNSGGGGSGYDGEGYDNAAGASGRPGTSPGFSSFGGGDIDNDDLFGGGGEGGSTTSRPSVSTTTRPADYDEDGSYKPEDDGFGTTDGDDSDDDLFGGGAGTKPSGAGTRPGGAGTRPGVTGTRPAGDDGGYSPSSGGVGTRPASPGARPRPTGAGTRPTEDDGNYRPSSGGAGGSKPTVTGSKPIGIGGSRPTGTGAFRPTRPDLPDEDDNDLDDDFGLFGGTGPSSSTKPPIISIGVTGGGGVTKPGRGEDKHTIVTNLGDTIFTVPPGVSVHAHVQSIDLFPYESKVPSPSEQFNAETSDVERKAKISEVRLSTTPMPSVTTDMDSTK